jgi:hypothetical protein
MANHTERRAYRIPGSADPDEQADTFLDWDPKRPTLLVATSESDSIHLINLSADEGNSQEILNQGKGSPTYGPRWSPSGRLLGFIRAGDIWLAYRKDPRSARDISSDSDVTPRTSPVVRGAAQDNLFSTEYYDHSNRISPVAAFNEVEKGASASTPHWAWTLAWTQKEDRLYFNFRRVSGSGLAEIAYLTLKAENRVQAHADNGSGIQTKIHWLPLEDVYAPEICPDDRSLSFYKRDHRVEGEFGIYVSDLHGKYLKELIPNAMAFDWRPR